MGEYSKFIAPERREVPTPESIVTPEGRAVFGTFDKEFASMDFVKLNKPTKAPNCMNKQRLTLWEACEVHLDNGVLLVAVSDMAFFGVTLNVFYDKIERKVHSWSTMLPSKKTFISPNLINGAETKAYTKCSHVRYVNDFQIGQATLEGHHDSEEEGHIEYCFELERLSKPSVVSIPFGENRPLYSQKDFFRAKGKLIFNGKEYPCTDNSTAVIDDHRGFYPRRAHYDWLSTMGREVNGKQEYFAFNLTRNQSIDQDKYNENLIWKEGSTSLLTPVHFERNISTADFMKAKKKGTAPEYAEWKVTCEHGMGDVLFKVYDCFSMIVHAGVVMIDYYIAFGEMEGYLLDEDGNKYDVTGLMGIGEDKTLLF